MDPRADAGNFAFSTVNSCEASSCSSARVSWRPFGGGWKYSTARWLSSCAARTNPTSVPRGVSRPSGSLGITAWEGAAGLTAGGVGKACPDAKPPLTRPAKLRASIRACIVENDFAKAFNTPLPQKRRIALRASLDVDPPSAEIQSQHGTQPDRAREKSPLRSEGRSH